MGTQRYFLIDPPEPFAPLEEWDRFLAELYDENCAGPCAQLEEAIQSAQEHITGTIRSWTRERRERALRSGV